MLIRRWLAAGVLVATVGTGAWAHGGSEGTKREMTPGSPRRGQHGSAKQEGQRTSCEGKAGQLGRARIRSILDVYVSTPKAATVYG